MTFQQNHITFLLARLWCCKRDTFYTNQINLNLAIFYVFLLCVLWQKLNVCWVVIKGDSQWFPQTYTLFVAYICKCIICQQEALKAGEIKVSTVTAVHKAALCSQTLLYHALQWYENTFDFETCSAHVYSTKSKLLENLFVAVSFDIVVGCHKYINVWETLYSITFANNIPRTLVDYINKSNKDKNRR